LLHVFFFNCTVYYRVQKLCLKKCVPKVHDADLAIGEMSCIDRCVPKYFETHSIVQEEFKKAMDMLSAQQQALPPS
jgi:import inner membrane translocase subunit TIM10